MLALSLLANLVLGIGLLVVVAKARSRIVEEKLATFAGCMSAITSGLAIEDVDRRMDAVSFGLASLRNKAEGDVENMKFYLSRASLLRIFRKATLGDIGENMRLLALQTVGDDDEAGSRMLEYISQAKPGDQEPVDLWGDELVSANFVAEKKALNIYRRQITSRPPSILG